MEKLKINKRERLEAILEYLERSESLTVSWLANAFSVSEVSIRNDLSELEKQGKIRRQHGKASLIRKNVIELPLREKELKNKQSKTLIGLRAAQLIENGDSVFLDAGTTTEYVAKNLQHHVDITVFTNGINVISTLLAYANVRMYSIGGEICHRSYAAIGEIAENAIDAYHTKIAFVSADGFSLDRGISNNSDWANRIAVKYLENTSKRILLVDSSKLGIIGPFHLCDYSDIDIMVSDDQLPESAREVIRSFGVELIIAS